MSCGGNKRCLFSDISKNRPTSSLKSKAQKQKQHQHFPINKINQKALIARLRDYINCCDDRIMETCEKRNNKNSSNNMRNVLVFSVVVLINLASLNCVAARQIEGELKIIN